MQWSITQILQELKTFEHLNPLQIDQFVHATTAANVTSDNTQEQPSTFPPFLEILDANFAEILVVC